MLVNDNVIFVHQTLSKIVLYFFRTHYNCNRRMQSLASAVSRGMAAYTLDTVLHKCTHRMSPATRAAPTPHAIHNASPWPILSAPKLYFWVFQPVYLFKNKNWESLRVLVRGMFYITVP